MHIGMYVHIHMPHYIVYHTYYSKYIVVVLHMYSTYNAIQMIHTLHNNTDVLIGTDECTHTAVGAHHAVHCELQYLSKLLPADSLGAVNDVVYNLKEVL